jgi:hypothetical protein
MKAWSAEEPIPPITISLRLRERNISENAVAKSTGGCSLTWMSKSQALDVVSPSEITCDEQRSGGIILNPSNTNSGNFVIMILMV